jgi:hypothetical protein
VRFGVWTLIVGGDGRARQEGFGDWFVLWGRDLLVLVTADICVDMLRSLRGGVRLVGWWVWRGVACWRCRF